MKTNTLLYGYQVHSRCRLRMTKKTRKTYSTEQHPSGVYRLVMDKRTNWHAVQTRASQVIQLILVFTLFSSC